MKKFFYLVAIIGFGAFVSSCNSDDDGSSSGNTENTIVGTWDISEIEMSSTSEEGTNSATIPASVCSEDYIFTFAANGNLTVTDLALDFDEAFEGNLDLACEVNGGVLNGTWQFVSGNTYVLVIDGESSQTEVNFSNGNNTFEITFINDQTDDPFEPFTQTIIWRGDRN